VIGLPQYHLALDFGSMMENVLTAKEVRRHKIFVIVVGIVKLFVASYQNLKNQKKYTFFMKTAHLCLHLV
jgi:hypothetical protein